ncbi:MAG TPA: T9SS type A sorting domain-containing protein, partial [Bacteroidia bacterium]|nr:T9SS type A sorting domain-containing protein [Bacteroidia bacterium]
NSDMITVTVNSLPNVQANATATVVCAGNMTTLTASGTATTYTWSGSVIDGTAFAPTNTNTYSVTGTDGNNCVNSDVVIVTVNTLPTVQANATATVVCAGQSTTLTGSGATTYTWTTSVVDGVAFAPTATDTYTVTGTDVNNCTNIASVMVTVNSLPATPTVTQAGNVLSSSVSGTSYQWYFNSAAITTNGTSATYTATANGVYQVEVFNASNCSSISATYTVSGMGIASVTAAKNVNVYPNPASSFITVATDTKISLIEMYDISGKVIISEIPSTNTHTIQLNGVEPGIYFLKTEKNNQISVQKIIVR